MRTAYAVIVPFGLACVFSTLCLHASPHWACLVLSVMTFGVLLTSLVLSAVIGFGCWRKSSAYWMLPTLVCLAFLTVDLFVPEAGRRLADYQFKKHIADYNEVVAEIRNTKNLQNAAIVEMGRAKHREYMLQNLRFITAEQCEDDSIVVAFTLNAQVPLLHEGYLYKDSGCTKEDVRLESKWPYLRPVTGNWYHFSDQPGL